MTDDARFEDGAERPLRLKAEDAEDITVVSALVQDAVLPASELQWNRKRRRFTGLLNRFRWEDKPVAERQRRDFERVQTLLVIEDVLNVSQQGLGARSSDTVLSLLSLAFEAGEDGMGRLVLTFAGDGAIGIEVEAINILLQDVTRPYRSNAGQSPSHPE